MRRRSAVSARTGLVTGAARGIGLAVARRLGREGVRLTLADRRAADLAAAAEELRREGIMAATVAGDVTAAADMERVARAASAGGRLDVLVHCAGISPSMADSEEILRVNLGGTLVTLAAVDAWLAEGSSVVLIGSTSAALAGVLFEEAIGDPRDAAVFDRLAPHLGPPGLAYGISKRAVIVLAQRLALPLGRRGIRINTVSPGLADTIMGHLEADSMPIIHEMQSQVPFSRLVRPEEVAAAVAFLAGPEASFIHGADLLVDGGCVATLGSRWGAELHRG
jgi:NAD(P)-dependent dehydrogenase (short-subunit alcohol dehydrogenase family)